ncbi:MAG: PepSY domain-containing protein, partial [Verrucomicrobiaceae bacterium]|nr:PepSY domain-containing protein [Verrucomicrobiaceae bacterium]
AKREHPGLILRQMMPAVEEGKKHFVSLMPPDWDPRKGHTQLWIDSDTGEFAGGWKGEEASALETLKTSSVAWHEDMGLGWFGEVLIFLSGLVLPILYVSGIVLWRKRVAGKKRARTAVVVAEAGERSDPADQPKELLGARRP